jgi:hypothetical protein
VDQTTGAGQSSPPDWTISNEGDDRFFLQSADFLNLEDIHAIRAHARAELLPVITGLAALLAGGSRLRSVELGSQFICEDASGNRREGGVTEGSVDFCATARMTIDVTGGKDEPPLRSLEEIVMGLRREPNVIAVLGLLADSARWTHNLWKIWEIVRLDVGDRLAGTTSTTPQERDRSSQKGENAIKEKLGWLTQEDLNRFKGIHDPTVTGSLARHAVQTRPSATNAMAREERARRFVAQLIERWLRWVYDRNQSDGWQHGSRRHR